MIALVWALAAVIIIELVGVGFGAFLFLENKGYEKRRKIADFLVIFIGVSVSSIIALVLIMANFPKI